MKKFIILLSIFLSLFCSKIDNAQNKKQLLALSLIYSFHDECVQEYQRLSPIPLFYNPYLFLNGRDVGMFGDSTLDYSRVFNFFNPSLTDNFAVQGNTACDFLAKMKAVVKRYKYYIIGSMDGNGISFGVDGSTSVKTLKKVVIMAESFSPDRIVLIGVHPVGEPDANSKKNYVNSQMKSFAKDRGHCFIDMVELFGVGENDLAPENLLLPGDKIHYNEVIYERLKNKINSFCGVIF